METWDLKCHLVLGEQWFRVGWPQVREFLRSQPKWILWENHWDSAPVKVPSPQHLFNWSLDSEACRILLASPDSSNECPNVDELSSQPRSFFHSGPQDPGKQAACMGVWLDPHCAASWNHWRCSLQLCPKNLAGGASYHHFL